MLGRLENRLKPFMSSEKSASINDDREKPTPRSNDAPKGPEVPSWLQLFPIRVRCKTAAAVLGNDNTRAVISAKLDSADGTFDAGHAGALDAFKLLFKFEFANTVIKMHPNHDFKQPQLAMAADLKNSVEEESDKRGKQKVIHCN